MINELFGGPGMPGPAGHTIALMIADASRRSTAQATL
jgi:hypothetical protein